MALVQLTFEGMSFAGKHFYFYYNFNYPKTFGIYNIIYSTHGFHGRVYIKEGELKNDY